MTIFLIIIHVIACLLLILVILLQAGRGQGLTGASFGGGNVQSLFGTRAADFLTKATTVAAILFLFTCIGLDWMEVQKSRSLMEGPRRVAPLDIDQVKKALEKVKGESPTELEEVLGDAAVSGEAAVLDELGEAEKDQIKEALTEVEATEEG